MNLTYNKGYDDYSDSRNWLPQFEFLKCVAEDIDLDLAEAMPDSQLLDTMEQLEELQRYYCAVEDMKNLEPVMRKYYDLLKLCKIRGISGMEYSYFDMFFQRINAILYRGHNQFRQAEQQYEVCLNAARQCFMQLKNGATTDTEQIVYIGWNCIECFKEAAEVLDRLLETNRSMALLLEMIPMLDWLSVYLTNAPGICDQVAEQYTTIGGVLSLRDHFHEADHCAEQAIALYNGLDARYGSDFYRARAIWTQCTHGLLKYMKQDKPELILKTEQEAADYILHRYEVLQRDRAIVEAAQGIVLYQRAVAVQQSGNLQQAILLMKDAIGKMKISLEVLEADFEGKEGYARSVVYRIASRVYSSFVGALDGISILYYGSGQYDLAENTLEEALARLADSETYQMTGSAMTFLRAEVQQYLALVKIEQGDIREAEFYGVQAADGAYESAKQTGDSIAWGIAVGSCSIMAETYLKLKNKPKALTYATMGLEACENLSKLMPDHPILNLQKTIQNYHKKASRRFF